MTAPLVTAPLVITSTLVKAWNLDSVHESWVPILNKALKKYPELELFVQDARNKTHVYPNPENVFSVLKLGIDDIKVVILGQDPYHGPGQAMGLSFAVPDGISTPPSLRNIIKEVITDLGADPNTKISLNKWVEQGVFLLNTILTVECGKPLSHSGQGWEKITDIILSELVSRKSGIVFMLWGKQAQKKIPLLGNKQIILETAHPSPLSVRHGFFGSRHFSKANELLGDKSINWI